MCYDDDAAPPAPPVGEQPYTATDLTLSAADGATFGAFDARPERPRAARIVLLPDVGGLSDFYRKLAGHLAGTGHRTVVIDWFGRTAGPDRRGEDSDNDPHMDALTREHQLADVLAGLDHLGDGDARILLGFCICGGTALYAAAQGLPADGAVAFYPWTGGWAEVAELPDDFVAGVRCPLLGLFGGADTALPAENGRRVRGAPGRPARNRRLRRSAARLLRARLPGSAGLRGGGGRLVAPPARVPRRG